jgi:hypothetical protein
MPALEKEVKTNWGDDVDDFEQEILYILLFYIIKINIMLYI